MRIDAFVGVAAGDQFAVFVKVFLYAVNDDFVIASEDRHITHG